jgi:AIPR protein
MEPITSLLAEMNDLEGVDPIMTHKHLGQAELFTSLADSPRQSVDFDVDLLNWGGGTSDPLRIFYGKVSGADVASWFQQHAGSLFAENIRVVIPRSEINAGILDTVRKVPERFGYYNNGITILAGSVNISPSGMLNRDVIRLGLVGASIVNGAQTVSTLGSVLGTEWEQNLGQVFVMTRCIEVPADDSEQHRLARELSILGYEYVIRQAEQPTTDDPTKIIYIRDAAVALACASADLGLAVTAKREVSRLFAQTGNEYRRIFNPSTDPLVLLNSVLMVRRVDVLLDGIANTASGVDLGVTVHGRLIVAHLVLKRAGSNNLKDPDWDLTSALEDLGSYVPDVAEKLARAFPDNSYPGNVFKNRSRCDQLVHDAGLVE